MILGMRSSGKCRWPTRVGATTVDKPGYPYCPEFHHQKDFDVNKLRYQAFLLTRLVQRNDYPTNKALLDAITAACEIPETEWGARKHAFNELQDKAPLRESNGLAIGHSDIPGYLEREWFEFSSYSNDTKGILHEADLEVAVRRFWLTDEDMGFGRYGRPLEQQHAPAPDDAEDDEPAPRM